MKDTYCMHCGIEIKDNEEVYAILPNGLFSPDSNLEEKVKGIAHRECIKKKVIRRNAGEFPLRLKK